MQRKLIVTLVAAALELYAATASAQANSCVITNAGSSSATNAGRVASGPLNPIDGFPEYVTDSAGNSMQRCLDDAVCFFDPVVTSDPFSVQIRSGGEAFYWSADAILTDPATTTPILKLVMAAETAFLQAGPNDEPINGSQLPFLRLRWVFDAPFDGTYTLSHPFGQERFTVVGATGNRDVANTVDRGFAPNQRDIVGPVGPFLIQAGAPAGYAGDINVLNTVTGGPCGNVVTLTGVGPDGETPIIFSNGSTEISTNQFAVQGKFFDGAVQTPMNSSRLTYSRSAAGRLEVFASSLPTATVTVADGPSTATATGFVAGTVTLDRSTPTALNATTADGINSTTVAVANAATLPRALTVTAADTVTPLLDANGQPVLNANGTPKLKFDPTAEIPVLVDFVDIASADFDPSTSTLSVAAVSGDQLEKPALTVRGLGPVPATGVFTLVTTAPPGKVTVDSAKGGSSTAQVRITAAVAPDAPKTLTASEIGSSSVKLSWVDASNNETGFRIYQVSPGTRTALTTSTTSSVVLTGLNSQTAYVFEVVAFNITGESVASNQVSVTTIAPPVAPTVSAPTLSETEVTSINVSWTDNATDETGYEVYRKIGTNGARTLIGTTAANVTSFVDGGRAINTTYSYEVRTLRNADASTYAASTAIATNTALATTAIAGQAPNGMGATATGTQVALSWGDRATNESRYVIRRCTYVAPATGCTNFVTIATRPANATSYTDLTAVPGTSYTYQVAAFRWRNQLASTVNATVPIANPTSVSATNASPNVLNWVDTQTGETGYRIASRNVTFTAAGAVTVPAAYTNLGEVGANVLTYQDSAATAGSLYQYRVQTLVNAATSAGITAYGVAGGIPAPTIGNVTRPTTGTAAQQSLITVRWTPPVVNAAIGGYRIQRCTVTATEPCADTGNWVNATTVAPATIVGRQAAQATTRLPVNTANITYRFRVIATTGSVNTGIESPPSAAGSVTR
ncbi:fibronectin type III domain-containing protein [Leptothrix discophora]|uniref:Fibronectin type III domain-containing protein n=1 Tax=Leptothrix discophora TaxID=89 RepID=A0ABT9G1V6_LEPDI|nr:fibronectin type III domain-containing protein [Leptothrix discophora]MDP4300386.1 fibronectin type III domain-containing protein [Leptothrix discophora]